MSDMQLPFPTQHSFFIDLYASACAARFLPQLFCGSPSMWCTSTLAGNLLPTRSWYSCLCTSSLYPALHCAVVAQLAFPPELTKSFPFLQEPSHSQLFRPAHKGPTTMAFALLQALISTTTSASLLAATVLNQRPTQSNMGLNPYLLCQLHAQEPCPSTSLPCYSSRVRKMRAGWFQFHEKLLLG